MVAKIGNRADNIVNNEWNRYIEIKDTPRKETDVSYIFKDHEEIISFFDVDWNEEIVKN